MLFFNHKCQEVAYKLYYLRIFRCYQQYRHIRQATYPLGNTRKVNHKFHERQSTPKFIDNNFMSIYRIKTIITFIGQKINLTTH